MKNKPVSKTVLSIHVGDKGQYQCPHRSCEYETMEWDEMASHLDFKHEWLKEDIRDVTPMDLKELTAMTDLEKFVNGLPDFMYGTCEDARDLAHARHLVLLELDHFTDEPIEERENGAIQTQRQYEKVKAYLGGHHD